MQHSTSMSRVYDRQRVMRGHGIGSIFASLFRRAIPLLKRGGKYLAKQALHTGSAAVKDIITGEEKPREAFRKHLKAAKKRVTADAKKRVVRYLQTGRGVRRVNMKHSGHGIRSAKDRRRKRTARRKRKAARRKSTKGIKRKRKSSSGCSKKARCDVLFK